MSEENNEVLIYERLSPGDSLVISKDKDSILVVMNKDGNVEFKRIYVDTGK